jgi:hypothetical protein
MRAQRLFACVACAAGLAVGQQHKLSIDPETKEGFVLQEIQQERSPVEKIKLMNQFVVEFPKSSSLAWVYDQLQPVYVASKDYDKVIVIGAKLMELDPDDLEASHSCLLAAEELKDSALIRKYAATSWAIASRLAKSPAYKKVEYANQMVEYSEYSVAKLVNGEPDTKRRQELTKALEEINPKSKWLKVAHSEMTGVSPDGAGRDQQAAAAEKTLLTQPDNEDALMLMADYHMQRGDNPTKVLEYSSRVIEIFRVKPMPQGLSEEDWDKKKTKYLGAAHYMVGVLSSIQGHYSQADRNLRAALPIIRNTNEQVLGAALYHLAYANYQLAEGGDRQRIFDALRYNEQCAGIHSTYSDQAKKNVDAIKSEYNLH